MTHFYIGDHVSFKLGPGDTEIANGVIVAAFSLAWHPNPFYVVEVGIASPTRHFHVRDGLLLSKEGATPLVSWRKDVSTLSRTATPESIRYPDDDPDYPDDETDEYEDDGY